MDQMTRYYKNRSEILKEQLYKLEQNYIYESMRFQSDPTPSTRTREQEEKFSIARETHPSQIAGTESGEPFWGPLAVDVLGVGLSLPRFGGREAKYPGAPRIVSPAEEKFRITPATALRPAKVTVDPLSPHKVFSHPFTVDPGLGSRPGSMVGELHVGKLNIPLPVGAARGVGEKVAVAISDKTQKNLADRLAAVAEKQTERFQPKTNQPPEPVQALDARGTTPEASGANIKAKSGMKSTNIWSRRAGKIIGSTPGLVMAAMHGKNIADDIRAGRDVSTYDAAMAGTGVALAAGEPVAKVASGVAKSAEKLTGKMVGKNLVKLIKLPLIGLGLGLYGASQRAMAGDWSGAGLEAASGVLSTAPGLGTAASVGIDSALLVRDLEKEEQANKPDSLEDDDEEKIKEKPLGGRREGLLM